jgi:hypothetical protein
MDKTDISVVLAAFSALYVVIGMMAALAVAAFLAGLILGQARGDHSEAKATNDDNEIS